MDRGVMRISVVAAIAIAAGLSGATPSVAVIAGPLVYSRPHEGNCPPQKPEPIEGVDAPLSGLPGDEVDWLFKRFHWDDGKGHDLTVEVWCVRAGPYFSSRIFLSTNGISTLVATPKGQDGTTETGLC
jgi:hypothetical protein